MAITKQLSEEITIDRYGNILHKQITTIIEDGKELAETFHRASYMPGDDVSTSAKSVQDYSKIAWTPSVIAAAQSRRKIK